MGKDNNLDFTLKENDVKVLHCITLSFVPFQSLSPSIANSSHGPCELKSDGTDRGLSKCVAGVR